MSEIVQPTSASHRQNLTSWAVRLRGNPVMIKELRSSMRGARAMIILSVYLSILGGAVSLSFIPLQAASVYSSGLEIMHVIGKSIFGVVTAVQLLTVAFIAPALTAGAISAERERQTFDILRTTLLTARQLVHGKLLAAVAFLMLILFAAFPVLSLSFLFGGVTFQEVAIAGLMLFTSTITFCSIGLIFSSALKRSLASTVLAYAVTILVFAGVPILLFMSSFLLDLFLFRSAPSLNSNLTIVLLAVLGWLLVASNPLLAGFLSELILSEMDSLWYVMLPSPTGGDFPVPSPWIGYVIGYLLLSLLLIRLSVRLVRRPER